MLKRFLLYGFPLYLIILEFLVKNLLNYVPGRHEEATVSSTSIASAGLLLLCPVLIPKEVRDLPPAFLQSLKNKSVSIVSKNDKILTEIAWIFLFLMSVAWGYCLFLSHRNAEPHNTALQFAESQSAGPHFPKLTEDLVLAVLIYLVGVLFTEVKEAIR